MIRRKPKSSNVELSYYELFLDSPVARCYLKSHNNQVMDGSSRKSASSTSHQAPTSSPHRAQGAPAKEEEWRLHNQAVLILIASNKLCPPRMKSADERRLLQRAKSSFQMASPTRSARRGRRAPAKEDCFSKRAKSSF
jgi:hypothetical protein